jgi:hypothetical protein
VSMVRRNALSPVVRPRRPNSSHLGQADSDHLPNGAALHSRYLQLSDVVETGRAAKLDSMNPMIAVVKNIGGDIRLGKLGSGTVDLYRR